MDSKNDLMLILERFLQKVIKNEIATKSPYLKQINKSSVYFSRNHLNGIFKLYGRMILSILTTLKHKIILASTFSL